MADVMAKGITAASILNRYIAEIGDDVLHLAGRLVIALLIIFIGFKIIKHIQKIMKSLFARSSIDPALETFLTSAVNISLKMLLIFIAVSELGVATSSIIAILGSAGIALGLSLQGSLSNIAGGVILLLMKPFKIGDYIYEGGTSNEGFVEAIGIMYTKLRTTDNRSILIPNGQLSSESIINAYGKESRQEDITVGVPYEESIDRIRNVLQEVIDEEEAVIRFQPMEIFVNDFKDSFVEMRIRFWVRTPDYWKCRWRTLENIKRKFDQNGISVPYNQLDVKIRAEGPASGPQ